jgi:hypothetical protein
VRGLEYFWFKGSGVQVRGSQRGRDSFWSQGVSEREEFFLVSGGLRGVRSCAGLRYSGLRALVS